MSTTKISNDEVQDEDHLATAFDPLTKSQCSASIASSEFSGNASPARLTLRYAAGSNMIECPESRLLGLTDAHSPTTRPLIK